MKPEPVDDFRDVVGPKIVYFLSGTWQPATLLEIARYVERDMMVTKTYVDLLLQSGKIRETLTPAGVGYILID